MITVENLDYTYPGASRPALQGVSFQVQDGEIFGFLGPSGAGKSTTQKVLNGILKGYKGKAEVNGQEVAKAKSGFYEDIGVAFEFPNLYLKLTAMENLQLYASFFKNTTEIPSRLLEMVGLAADRDTRVEAFSKGMKMRLNFARALVNRPKLLFLDEPTSGLDPTNARKLKDIILGLKHDGTTVFLTTHDMHVADELCDHLAFMVDGRLPLVEEPRKLKLQHGKKQVKIEYHSNHRTESREFDLHGIGNDPVFLDILKMREIETIHTREASLEDIFIKLTGQKLSPHE
jgi:fluoroquinolone transport system ATP-binding protein